MNDTKGFTLTEVLLAVMIVGVIGIALAALTTAAVRESGAGRARLMLRNQISLFLRQLRQDIRESSKVTCSGGTLTLEKTRLGPEHNITSITYSCMANSECNRSGEIVLSHIQGNAGSFASPSFSCSDSAVTVQMLVGMNSDPAVKEVIQEVILLPHGLPEKQ